MPFHVKFNIFRVSHGCVMCRAISPRGAAAGSPERGHGKPPGFQKHGSLIPPTPQSSRPPRVPPLHLAGKLPAEDARRNGRGRECAGQLRRTGRSGGLFVFFPDVYGLPGTSPHKELLCWCYTGLFIGACAARCTWGLAPLCLLHFPVNCQFIALQRSWGWEASGLTFCHQ